jgi:hypothetical protein
MGGDVWREVSGWVELMPTSSHKSTFVVQRSFLMVHSCISKCGSPNRTIANLVVISTPAVFAYCDDNDITRIVCKDFR